MLLRNYGELQRQQAALDAENLQLNVDQHTTHDLLLDAFKALADPLGKLELDIIEPHSRPTALSWAHTTKVLLERFSELLGILAVRAVEDVADAVRETAGYVLQCYHSRDPNFDSDVIR